MEVKERVSPDVVNSVEKSASIYHGMPALEHNDKPLSFFEFWPGSIVYIPVIVQWLLLSVRYRSLSLPLISNPSIPLSGMVGESKADIFSQASGEAKHKIAPWVLLSVLENIGLTLHKARLLMKGKKLKFPLVAKPDIGCRGAGVRIVKNTRELKEYVEHYPQGSGIILQKLIDYKPEAGVFYIRKPGKKKGEIISITLKYPPYVVGNGIDTLEQLIKNDKRAGRLSDLYLSRHKNYLKDILPSGQPFRLAFAGSHCRGSIFRDGRKYITQELVEAMDRVCDGLPEYYYGRIDLRFKDIESLMAGHSFLIQEINGASSEAAHIWDSRSSLRELYRILFYQYRTLFQIGAVNRQRGFKTPGLIQLWKAWKKEKSLLGYYPDTE